MFPVWGLLVKQKKNRRGEKVQNWKPSWIQSYHTPASIKLRTILHQPTYTILKFKTFPSVFTECTVSKVGNTTKAVEASSSTSSETVIKQEPFWVSEEPFWSLLMKRVFVCSINSWTEGKEYRENLQSLKLIGFCAFERFVYSKKKKNKENVSTVSEWNEKNERFIWFYSFFGAFQFSLR